MKEFLKINEQTMNDKMNIKIAKKRKKNISKNLRKGYLE